jgi:hypothetical protein
VIVRQTPADVRFALKSDPRADIPDRSFGPIATDLMLRLSDGFVGLRKFKPSSLLSNGKKKVLLRALEIQNTAARAQLIQGLAVAVDAGWPIGGRGHDAFGIDRRA